MTFTIFSAVLLLCVGLSVLKEVMKGLRQGFGRTAISLATVVFSALVAAPLAYWLSDLPAEIADSLLLRLLPGITTITKQFPSINDLLVSIIDATISPLMFVVFYAILRPVSRLLVAIIFSKRMKPKPDDTGDPVYESENAPWHRRHSRALGGVTGGLCGFLISLILLSPTIGFLSTADAVFSITDSVGVKWKSLGVKEEYVTLVRNITHDPVVRVLEVSGGGLIYDATAATTVNDKRVIMRQELHACADVVTDVLSLTSVLKNKGQPTEEQAIVLDHLGEKIDKSEVTKMVLSDTLNRAADSWLTGKTFLGMSRPSFGKHVDPLMNGVLSVCAYSEPVCVGRDISTLLHVYLIATDSGLLSNPSFDALADNLSDDENSIITRIYAELQKNPCTAGLTEQMTDMAIHIMASAIEASGFNDFKLDGLMTDLSGAVNLVNGMGSTNAERVESMKEYTTYYAKKYGVEVPDSLAEMAAVAFVDKLGNTGGKVTAEDLQGLFDQYLSGSGN